MLVETNKKRAKAFFNSYSLTPQDVLDCLHEDVVWWVSGTLPGLSGSYKKSDIAAFLAPMDAVYKKNSLKVIPLSMIGEKDFLAVEAISEAELKDGRQYRNTYHFLLKFRDDKLILVKEYMDSHHAWELFLADK